MSELSLDMEVFFFFRFLTVKPPIGIGGPTRRAISSAVERAPDNCHGVLFLFESEFETKLLLRRIDGAIQVRSNVDLTFYSLVGPGRSGGDHHGSSLLENPYTPYQSPNNASSQTKNYEIAPFILGDGGIVLFEPFFSCFSGGSGESSNQ
ncbi:hypothetical protein LUZ63_022646 [Rhynchospora breviuscula]|uniref:Uncharacterized protein ycf68 n=1 Tax=Rhynchospora breviuscula TaxID=2022672 RepID=A0A9P9Z4C9_9POAL|nr:hypothetical protein LUZ63_022646 [Rhynchospora breviuscula]